MPPNVRHKYLNKQEHADSDTEEKRKKEAEFLETIFSNVSGFK
jgi:ABC-type sulfate transport system substrate-binding protein